MIDDKLKAAIERALKNGLRVQLKRMKDGSVKAQIIKAENSAPEGFIFHCFRPCACCKLYR